MSRIHLNNFIKFASETRNVRFLSDFQKQNTDYRRQFKKSGKKQRSKKDTTPRIPLPDIIGEALWGIHPVQAALSAEKRHVHTAFFKIGVTNNRVNMIRSVCETRNVNMYEMKGNTLDLLVGNHPHQGVCLDVSPLPIEDCCVDDITRDNLIKPSGKAVVWMLPYRVKDTMNMGAILRSSHYFGVDRVLVPSMYSSAMNSVVSKASAGAMEIMDIKSVKDGGALKHCLQTWRNAGGIVVGSTSDIQHRKSLPLQDFYSNKPVLLITGSESEGLDNDIIDMCDVLLSIPTYQPQQTSSTSPMFQLDSLNVSVATGVLLYTIINNRLKYNG